MTPKELFNTNQSLVGWCYKTYIGDYKTIHQEDIIQEGCLALWQACLNFDEAKGFKFSTYAVPYITGKMRQYYRSKCNVIRIPRCAFEGNVDILNTLRSTLSLDANIENDDGDGATMGELISGGSDSYEFITEELIDSFISSIENETDRSIMEEYYYNYIWGLGLKVTQKELGDKYGISQAQCSRIIKTYNNKFIKFLNE